MEVEKNIPVPVGKAIYPWSELEVGDSFFVDNTTNQRSSSICTSGRIYYKSHGIAKSIKCRKEGSGHRFWAIKK